MLRNFPGRTLEELDSMDWGRFLRAIASDGVRQVEEKRIMQQQGLIKPDKLSEDDWKAFQRHERILERWPANPE